MTFLVFHPICVCNCKHKQPPRDCLHLDIFCIDPRLLSNHEELPRVNKYFISITYLLIYVICSFLCRKLQKCGRPTSEASSLKVQRVLSGNKISQMIQQNVVLCTSSFPIEFFNFVLEIPQMYLPIIIQCHVETCPI